jgi:hypothetical protein
MDHEEEDGENPEKSEYVFCVSTKPFSGKNLPRKKEITKRKSLILIRMAYLSMEDDFKLFLKLRTLKKTFPFYCKSFKSFSF